MENSEKKELKNLKRKHNHGESEEGKGTENGETSRNCINQRPVNGGNEGGKKSMNTNLLTRIS